MSEDVHFSRKKEGIRGLIICDLKGLPIKSNLPAEQTEDISRHLKSLIETSKQFVNALKEGVLKFIRLETSKGEIMIAFEKEYI